MPDQVGADLAEEWMAEGPVLLNYGKHVATLTLNRPEAFNGMNIALMCALHEAVMRCHAEPRVRVVHLRGNGSNFCAGGDLREFASEDEQLGDFLREVTAYLQMAVGALVRLNSVPRAMATSKRLLWTGLGIGVESCLPEEARTVAELSATADTREGLAAVLEKRTPVFGGRWAWRAQSAHW